MKLPLDGADKALLARLRSDPEELGSVLEGYRNRMRTMIRLRLDPRVKRRIDASDVIQDAFVEVSTRLPRYLEDPDMPFYAWVRFITGQRLLKLHRQHLNIRKRDVRRETRVGLFPDASSLALAKAFVDSAPSPSQMVSRQEELGRLKEALESMRPLDREVVALRHFEGLGNSEVAAVLGIEKKAASIRYVRALRRLGNCLRISYADDPGGNRGRAS